MSPRKKLVSALAGIEIFLCLLALIIPVTLFPVCDSSTHHCRQSYMAICGVAVLVITAAAGSIFSKGIYPARPLSIVTAVGGAMFIVIPSFVIGVCASPMMACHYGDLPVWNLCGGAVIILSVVSFLAAKGDVD
ncbi:MAG: DUF4418 family protein [Nitrospirota bacterium]